MADNIPSWAQDAPAVPDWASDNHGAAQQFGTLGADGKRHYDWSEIPDAAQANADTSADKFGAGVSQLVQHPIDSTVELGRTVMGGLDKTTFGALGRAGTLGAINLLHSVAPELSDKAATLYNQFRQGNTDRADAFGHDLYDHYGSIDNLKRTVAEDPIRFFTDFVGLLGGGTGGTAGTAVKGATKAAKGADVLAQSYTELTSGVSREAQQLAQKAGRTGGENAAAFKAQIKAPDFEGLQDTGQRAVQGARAERSAQYDADMAAVNNSQNFASHQPVMQSIIDAANENRGVGGFIKNPDVDAVLQEMGTQVQDHYGATGGHPSPKALDEFKQRLRQIMMKTEQGTPERRAASNVYDAARGEITRVAPEYGTAMENYGAASDNINEATKSLSLGERATRFSTAGKLLSSLRGDASVARGSRLDAVSDLARHEPTLPYQIAGATMNPVMPRGLVARGKALLTAAGVAGGGGAAAFLPHALAAAPGLALSSPRAVGNIRYGMGVVQRVADKLGVSPDSASRLLEALRMHQQTRQDQ